jgi:hypothetical protein
MAHPVKTRKGKPLLPFCQWQVGPTCHHLPCNHPPLLPLLPTISATKPTPSSPNGISEPSTLKHGPSLTSPLFFSPWIAARPTNFTAGACGYRQRIPLIPTTARYPAARFLHAPPSHVLAHLPDLFPPFIPNQIDDLDVAWKIPPPGALRSCPAISRGCNPTRRGWHQLPRIQTHLVDRSITFGSPYVVASNHPSAASSLET